MQQNEEVILAGAALDVHSDNYEEFDQEIDPGKLGKKLIQSNPRKGSIRRYQHYAEKHLLLNFIEKQNAPEKKFRVNLACLSSEPEHNKIITWKWLYRALAAGALAGLFLFLASTDAIRLDYSIVAGTITLTTALICFLIFIYQMRDEYIFKSYFGGAKLFLIENKKPTQQEFDNFFTNLQQTIDRAQANIPVADRLVDELKMCRRLKDEGIIDEQTYTDARTIIFKHEQYKV
jgi:hypothetical protein